MHQPASTCNWHRRGRGEEEEGRRKEEALLCTLHLVLLTAAHCYFHNWPSTISPAVYPSPAPTEQRADPRLPEQKETFHCLLGRSVHNSSSSALHPGCSRTTTTSPGRCKLTLNSNLKRRLLNHNRET